MRDEVRAKTSLPPSDHPRAGTVLAFDFGTKRIGIAVGDFETRLAHPLTTLTQAGNRERFSAIGALIAEWRPVLLVVGLPSRTDGTEHPVGRLAQRFGQRLQGRFDIVTKFVDEHLTSHDAEETLRGRGARGERLKGAVDAVAAQRILETFFEGVTRDR